MDHPQLATEFHDRLLRYSQEQDEGDRRAIEQQLWEKFGQTITVVIIDMSGYTRLVSQYGVIHYLSMIRRLQLTVQPIVENYGGRIVKFEADNADACFDHPSDAITACVALNMALDSANILTPDHLDVHVSCGIDHGRCLLPDEHHFYGQPVIRASKLGEDLGRPGQILVTEEAMAIVPESFNLRSEILAVELGGQRIDVHSIIYRRRDSARKGL